MKTTALFGAVAALLLGGAPAALGDATFQEWGDPQGWTEDKWSDNDAQAFDMMFESRLQRAFAAIDSSNDQSISFQEWGEWQADGGFYAERFDMFDSDGDRSISWREYRTATMSLYDTSALMGRRTMGNQTMGGAMGGHTMGDGSMQHDRMMREAGSMARGHPMNDGQVMDQSDPQGGDRY